MKQTKSVINSLKKNSFFTIKKNYFELSNIIKIQYFYWFDKKLYTKNSTGQVIKINNRFYFVYFTIASKIKGVWCNQKFGLHSPFILLIKKLFFY